MLNRAESPGTSCSTGLEDRIARQVKEFDHLVNSIEDSFIENRVSLIDIKKSIKNIPISLKRDLGSYFRKEIPEILKAETLESIFVFLSYYWDYLNTGLLEFLVDKFGSDNDKKLLDVYSKKTRTISM